MKKVMQTVTIKDQGDCMRAALASMLELDITQVPNFLLFGKSEWFKVWYNFIRSCGYSFDGRGKACSEITRKNLVNGCIYVSVRSRTYKGKNHAVLINSRGRVIHDPNPNQKFKNVNIFKTGEFVSWYIIRKEA